MNKNFDHLPILLVINNHELQKEIFNFLELYLPHIECIDNEEESFKYFKQHKPKIIITDHNPPELDGLFLANQIKSLSPESQIILLSDPKNSEMFPKAVDIGIDRFVNKPIRMEKLVDAINKCANIHTACIKEKEQIIMTTEVIREAKVSLLKDISHHWRNPLNIISLSLDAMQHVMKDHEACQHHCDKYFDPVIKTCGDMSRTLSYFTRIFDFSEWESTFCLNQCLKETLDFHKNWFSENLVTVEQSLSDNLYNVTGIQTNLRLALYHIINNAIEAISQKPDIRRIHVSLYDESGMAVIEFQDNGPGFDQTILHCATDPYCTSKGVAPGKGMGLFLTTQIIRAFKGKLNLENNEKGARVTLRIPLVTA